MLEFTKIGLNQFIINYESMEAWEVWIDTVTNELLTEKLNKQDYNNLIEQIEMS